MFDAQWHATILSAGAKGGAYIEFPFDTEQLFATTGRVKVEARFDEQIIYRGSLVRMETDCHILGVRKEILQQLNKTIGDTILVEIKKDDAERIVEVPFDVQQELATHKQAAVFYETLSYSQQKKYIDWIVSAKQESTRKQRVTRTIEQLENKEKKQ